MFRPLLLGSRLHKRIMKYIPEIQKHKNMPKCFYYFTQSPCTMIALDYVNGIEWYEQLQLLLIEFTQVFFSQTCDRFA